MGASQYLRADDLLARLQARYAAPTYAFFKEIKESVGYSNRRADAVAVAMWRSHGLYIHGFEIKTDRRDWLRELKQPGKSEGLFRQCDLWWLVVGDPAIVKAGELPAKWGLIIPHGQGLKIEVQAPPLKPDLLNREFMCEILRSCYVARRGLNNEDYQAGFKAGFDRAKQQQEELLKNVRIFEEASGLRIADCWPSELGRVGEIVKAIKEGAHHHARENLKYMLEHVRRIEKDLQEALGEKVAHA